MEKEGRAPSKGSFSDAWNHREATFYDPHLRTRKRIDHSPHRLTYLLLPRESVKEKKKLLPAQWNGSYGFRYFQFGPNRYLGPRQGEKKAETERRVDASTRQSEHV